MTSISESFSITSIQTKGVYGTVTPHTPELAVERMQQADIEC